MMTPWIFRLCTPEEWDAFREEGRFAGNDSDRRDGFIHFSTAEQIPATAARHYPAEGPLVLVAVATDRLGDALRWEESRNGDLFPHLYGTLTLTAVWGWRPMPDRDFAFLKDFAEPTETNSWTCTPSSAPW